MSRTPWTKVPPIKKTQPIRVQKGVLINSEFEFSPPESPKDTSLDLVPDTSHDWSDTNSDSENNDNPPFSPDRLKNYKHRHKNNQSVWSSTIGGKPRILSQGDLRFNVGSDIVAVLPCYFDKSSNSLCALYGVRGIILDINYVSVGDWDIPRETKLRSSPLISSSDQSGDSQRTPSPSLKESFQSDLSWANDMISDAKCARNPNVIQTVVTSYVILIHKSQRLTTNQVERLYSYVNNNAKLPYKYDLEFGQSGEGDDNLYDKITVRYRYVMGTYHSCIKHLKQNHQLEQDDDENIIAINRALNGYSLHSSIAVHYEDINPITNTQGRQMKFLVLDHHCKGPFDLHYVIDPVDTPTKILALVPLTCFDIRGHYISNSYYSFHPLDRYNYSVEPSYTDGLNKIRTIIRDLFTSIKVFSVKRSLCKNPQNLFEIYEEITPREDGNRQVVYKPQRSKLDGYNPTGIFVSSYVNGLAYPDKQLPSSNDQYIFFDSKEYCSLDLDPFSETFMELSPVDSETRYFREPCGRDVLLGSTFHSDRQNFKGKENLKWFYPSEDIRIFHYIVSNSGKRMNSQGIASRNSFRGEILCLYDLWTHGSGTRNLTLHTEFTQKFLRRFLWILLLETRLEADENFKR